MEIPIGIKLLGWLGLSVLSAILYRMGGSDKYKTLWRDIGCALCLLLLLILLGGFVYNIKTLICLALTTLLTYGSLTTYFKKKGTDVKWYNWIIVGVMWGVAALPYAYATQHWWGAILRTMFLGVAVCVWSEFEGNAVKEELGRGFLLVSSVPLLLI